LALIAEAGVGMTRLALEALGQAGPERYMVKRAVATQRHQLECGGDKRWQEAVEERIPSC
jgi:hypothetical protein